MTTYIIHHDELEKLVKGELKVEDIEKPENIGILTWSGADIINWIENNDKIKVKPTIDEGFVNDVADRLDGCGCGDCVSSAIYDYTNEVLKEIFEELETVKSS